MPAEISTGKMNPDLARERQKCTFDREELATYWIGDARKLEEKRARGECEIWELKLVHGRREEVKVHVTRHWLVLAVPCVCEYFATKLSPMKCDRNCVHVFGGSIKIHIMLHFKRCPAIKNGVRFIVDFIYRQNTISEYFDRHFAIYFVIELLSPRIIYFFIILVFLRTEHQIRFEQEYHIVS